ncbi:hypothetical protein F5890DRAFT_1522779 [Lentinula detonsa]|uniref:T6SS Phospholipase effector Tle1-like catalytic domain-containing protein n=1 Tax=Lentinula detonsa TaxID=2804962 RepID=A0AA38PX20_9AGAR|nr:hypothetical protein F5890DRAFT_1522779 [Lentinula detonsa]
MPLMSTQHQRDATGETSITIGNEVEKVEEELNVPKGLLFSVDPPAEDASTASPPPSRPRPLREYRVDSRIVTPIIPPEHDHRTLILCFDGTGDQFDVDNSNIVQVCSLLRKDDLSKQMVYYQAGIGTYTSPKVATPMMSRISKATDMLFANQLNAHVMDGYEFLMQNYTAGDRICMFGFSRGAYTARSLAGMLHKVGLLSKDNFQQVPFAYKMYTRVDKTGWEQSNAFKEAFCRDVTIHFLGVWDTVDSVGLIPKRLPFTTSNTIVRTFRHAISLDERRAKFKPNLWNLPYSRSEHSQDLPPSRPTYSGFSYRSIGKERVRQVSRSPKQRLSPLPASIEWESSEDNRLSDFEERFSLHSEFNTTPTDVQEVWFAGCHCDVGGGSVKNSTRHSLARISLRWMVRECFKANTGMMFNSQRLKSIGLDPSTLYPFVTPRLQPLSGENHTIEPVPRKKNKLTVWRRVLSGTRKLIPGRDSESTVDSTTLGANSMKDAKQNENEKTRILSEEEEDLMDVLSPKYDQLKISPLWWILEVIPMQFRYQRKCDDWVSYFGFNMARPRHIPEQSSDGVCIHRSVQMRMEAEKAGSKGKGLKYSPKARLELVKPNWVY